MQHLQFEASWDKALAAEDRHTIENIFQESKHLNSTKIHLVPIRQAINHKEELLVTVLVHNFTEYPLNFHDTRLLYTIQGEAIANHVFTLPALVIPSNVSMPWTFIFPKGSYTIRSSFENGQLEFS